MDRNQPTGRIPVIAGVTGHRDLREEDIGILKDAFRREILSLQAKCPNSEIAVMTCLAEGADQLCAKAALEMGLALISVLPMPIDEYAEVFEGEARDMLYDLAARSDEVFVAPHKEPFRQGKRYLYRQAGIYISGHCHVLYALWDGAPGETGGCGTAAIIETKLRNITSGGAGDQLRRTDGTVIQITTPRRKHASAGLEAGKVIVHGSVSTSDRILSDTDTYNLDCSRLAGVEASEDKLGAVYNASDSLSVINAVRNRRTLIGLSTCATVLTIAFLLYDEANWHNMILLCALMIAALFAINAFTEKSRFHERYLEYRVLAEACRVQRYLRAAGISCEVTDIMPWNLQVTIPWINSAMASVMARERPSEKQSILNMWIIDQRDYQCRALKRTEAQKKRNDWIVGIALVVTVLSYITALVFEIVCCGMLGGDNMFSPEVNETVRAGIKLAMGTFSALTLFANNYYGKLALPDVIDDHRKMILLYEEAEREIADKGEAEQLLVRIAEDELGENANWYAYQSKNGPGLDF